VNSELLPQRQFNATLTLMEELMAVAGFCEGRNVKLDFCRFECYQGYLAVPSLVLLDH